MHLRRAQVRGTKGGPRVLEQRVWGHRWYGRIRAISGAIETTMKLRKSSLRVLGRPLPVAGTSPSERAVVGGSWAVRSPSPAMARERWSLCGRGCWALQGGEVGSRRSCLRKRKRCGPSQSLRALSHAAWRVLAITL